MNAADVLSRLSRRGLFRIKPELDRMQAIMRALNDPQEGYPSVHIAGTNGKGSVAAGLEAVLRAAGKKTGLYISPHLVDLRERIQISAHPIGQNAFETAAETVYQAEKITGLSLTYFEFLTAMAFVAFRNAHVDIAIVEVGLGGLWDATNVLSHPLLSIITSIGTDHHQWLGPTRTAIALQKAGIIKPDGTVISGVRGAPGRSIAAVAKRQNASLRQLDRDFKVQPGSSFWLENRQSGLYKNKDGDSLEFIFGLIGNHQMDNASLVIEAVQQLRLKGWDITEGQLLNGLREIHWPGRFFLRRQTGQAPILFDGAHNSEAMRAFLGTLRYSPWHHIPKTLIFSSYRDKDYRTMALLLKRIPQKIILCRLPGSRGLDTRELSKAFRTLKALVEIVESPQAALRRALASTPQNHLIMVTGSLALVGMLLPFVSPLAGEADPQRRVRGPLTPTLSHKGRGSNLERKSEYAHV